MPYTSNKPYVKSPAPSDDKALYRYIEEELKKVKAAIEALNAISEELKARVTF